MSVDKEDAEASSHHRRVKRPPRQTSADAPTNVPTTLRHNEHRSGAIRLGAMLSSRNEVRMLAAFNPGGPTDLFGRVAKRQDVYSCGFK